MSDIVGEITSASVEQSSGVQQVGDAVSQMDQVTQQNAALVEESAAAESLKNQAQQLVQAVAMFKLSQNAGHQASGSVTHSAHRSGVLGAQTRGQVRTKSQPRSAGKAGPAALPKRTPESEQATAESWESF